MAENLSRAFPGSHSNSIRPVDLIAGEGGARPYRGVDRWHPGKEEHFREWHGGTRVTTGAVRLTEYNFKTPHAAQEVDRPSPTIADRARMESFDWPGDYLDRGESSGVVARQLEEERDGAARHRAKGEVALCRTWHGSMFDLEPPRQADPRFAIPLNSARGELYRRTFESTAFERLP